MIKFKLDEVMFKNGKMKVPQLQELSGINRTTLYAIYNNKYNRADFSVLNRLCIALECQPGDLLEYVPDKEKV
jgi:Predicted transcriptional regulator